MKMNNSTSWSIGGSKVVWQVNTQYHETVKNVPYVLTFGQCPGIGIPNLPVDPSILDTLHTKAQLNMVTNFNLVNKTPVIETPHSLDSNSMDKVETYTSDVAVENVKDNHGEEVPKDNGMVRKKCLCHSHSGDNSNCCLHTYNPIWNQTSPMCMEL